MLLRDGGGFVLPLNTVQVDRKEGRPSAEGGQILSGRWTGPGRQRGEVPTMEPGALTKAFKPRPLRTTLIGLFNRCH